MVGELVKKPEHERELHLQGHDGNTIAMLRFYSKGLRRDAIRLVHWYHHRPCNRWHLCSSRRLYALRLFSHRLVRSIPLSPPQPYLRYSPLDQHPLRLLLSNRNPPRHAALEYTGRSRQHHRRNTPHGHCWSDSRRRR